MNNNIELIIIDDHEMVLQGLEALLNVHSGIKVIGTFTNGIDAVNNFDLLNPDIILCDINMPVINGFETSKALLEKDKSSKIVFISMEVKPAYIEKALRENISGYMSKIAPIEMVVSTIRKVHAGEKCFEMLNNHV